MKILDGGTEKMIHFIKFYLKLYQIQFTKLTWKFKVSGKVKVGEFGMNGR